MRYLIVFLLIIFLGCNEKVAETGTLKIMPKYCKYKFAENHKFPILRDYILYKGSKEIPALQKNELFFNDLSFGDYHIEYTTIYNERKQIDFKINESVKEVYYCVDAIAYEKDQNILLIDELKTNETLQLHYKIRGCFHGGKEDLKITKTETTYILSYVNKNYTLSEKQIQLFREFEIELYKNHSSICSTIGTYTIGILANNKNFERFKAYKIVDGSCVWRGFPNLIALLNLE